MPDVGPGAASAIAHSTMRIARVEFVRESCGDVSEVSNAEGRLPKDEQVR